MFSVLEIFKPQRAQRKLCLKMPGGSIKSISRQGDEAQRYAAELTKRGMAVSPVLMKRVVHSRTEQNFGQSASLSFKRQPKHRFSPHDFIAWLVQVHARDRKARLKCIALA